MLTKNLVIDSGIQLRIKLEVVKIFFFLKKNQTIKDVNKNKKLKFFNEESIYTDFVFPSSVMLDELRRYV